MVHCRNLRFLHLFEVELKVKATYFRKTRTERTSVDSRNFRFEKFRFQKINVGSKISVFVPVSRFLLQEAGSCSKKSVPISRTDTDTDGPLSKSASSVFFFFFVVEGFPEDAHRNWSPFKEVSFSSNKSIPIPNSRFLFQEWTTISIGIVGICGFCSFL